MMASDIPSLPCLDLFSTPKTQNEILRTYPVIKGTSSALDDSMDLEFVFEQVKIRLNVNIFLYPYMKIYIF